MLSRCLIARCSKRCSSRRCDWWAAPSWLLPQHRCLWHRQLVNKFVWDTWQKNLSLGTTLHYQRRSRKPRITNKGSYGGLTTSDQLQPQSANIKGNTKYRQDFNKRLADERLWNKQISLEVKSSKHCTSVLSMIKGQRSFYSEQHTLLLLYYFTTIHMSNTITLY